MRRQDYITSREQNQNTLEAHPDQTIKALADKTDLLLESTKALVVNKAASAGTLP